MYFKTILKRNLRSFTRIFIRKLYEPITYLPAEDTICILRSKDPIELFEHWFEDARNSMSLIDSTAMLLGVANRNGVVEVRAVKIEAYSEDGFIFYTYYNNRTSSFMEENPHIAGTLFWPSYYRVIRIEGVVEKVTADISDKYFSELPVRTQIGILASKQDEVIPNRDCLMKREKFLEKKYPVKGKVIPRPNYWGGYRLRPHCIEFYQGRADRLHDRIRFRYPRTGEQPDDVCVRQGESGWLYERLAP